MKRNESKPPTGKSSVTSTLLQRNGTLFTVFLVALILVAGSSMVTGSSTWWMSALAISFVFMGVFVFLNARVMLKALAVTVFTILIANAVLQLAIVLDAADPSTSGNVSSLTWMTSILFLYCFLLALSYMTIGYRSRWTGIFFAVLTQALVTISFFGVVHINTAVVISLIFATLVFLFYYKILGHLLAHPRSMPKHDTSSEVEKLISSAASEAGWSIRKVVKKSRITRKLTVNYLVWDDRAFVLHPVHLDSAFAASPTRKSVKLTHNGHSINPWLLNLVNKGLPLWRARNASMMLVLLDLDSLNGRDAHAIGVAIPDSSKRVPVGIAPASTKRSKSRPVSFISVIEREFSDFVEPLTDKQKDAISEIGVTDGSTYL